MKFNNRQLKQLHKTQKEFSEKRTELYLAKNKHRVMKRAFKGIMSYPKRKILFQIGQNNGQRHS